MTLSRADNKNGGRHGGLKPLCRRRELTSGGEWSEAMALTRPLPWQTESHGMDGNKPNEVAVLIALLSSC
jgi:hypothetical protein